MSQIATSKFISKGNVRKVDKRSAEYKALKDNIKVKGIRTPVTYKIDDNGDYVIINGHQRIAIAKELKVNEILACEVNGDASIAEEQISVNMFTVPMTVFDASSAILKIMETEPDITRKELQLRFGKNAQWVQKAITFTNIMPELRAYMEKEPPNPVVNNEINDIAEHTTSKQAEAIAKMYDEESIVLAEHETIENTLETFIVDYYGEDEFYEELASTLASSPWQWTIIKETIGEEKFREYEKDAHIEHSYAHSIFSEYAKDQWHDDKGFLANVYIQETDVGLFLKDLHINDEMNSWGESICKLPNDVWNSKSKFYTAMKNVSGEPFSNVELVEWNGNIFNPYVKFHVIEKKVTTTDKDGNEVETVVSENYDSFKNSYNKINKWLYPIVKDMFFYHSEKSSSDGFHILPLDPPINIFKKDDNDMNIVVKWLVQDTSVTPRLAMPWFHDDGEDVDYHPLYNFTTKNVEKPFNNDMLLQHMGLYWFDHHFNDLTYAQIDKLLNLLGESSICDVLITNYEQSEAFRVSYLNLFSVKVLGDKMPVKPKNKADAVETLANQLNMPFMENLFTVSGQQSRGFLKEYKPKETE